MLDAELDFQLLEYLIFSPIGILSAYPLDELDVSTRYSWPTDFIGSRSPTPEQLESLTVPTDDGIWLCDDESRFLTIPNSGQEHPENPIQRLESRRPFSLS